jgi:hypothetical protein
VSYQIILRNLPERGQRQIEPVLVNYEIARVDAAAQFAPVRFAPRLFQAVRCTRPMVYGVGGVSPRIRMRRVDQLGGRRMQTDRYQPIG